jgi:hypothetical protein
MDIIEGVFTKRMLNITKAGEDIYIYVRGTDRSKGGSYKHGETYSGVEGKTTVWCVSLYITIIPIEFAANMPALSGHSSPKDAYRLCAK